jgi:hypothetical protein
MAILRMEMKRSFKSHEAMLAMVRKELISETRSPDEKLHRWVDKGRFL